MAQIVMLKQKVILLIFSLCLFSQALLAAQQSDKVMEANRRDVQTELAYLKDKQTNQIAYFDNRFRLDAQLDEVTLLFYRISGSRPVILIRPDGSKLRINDYDKTRVQWFDDVTFDMIRIKKPMPGPWQVVGDVLPNSKIMVLTDIRIEVEPLPDVLLSREILKIKATLHNGEQAIDQPAFRDAVYLDVDFISTNNTEYDNFAADPVELTTFRDDGRELDEYAADGIYTGEFQLNLAVGEWLPIYSIKLPMAERKLEQDPVIIRPLPVDVSVDITTDELAQHVLKLAIDDECVKPESLIFQGNITYPDDKTSPFSIMEGEGGDLAKMRLFPFGYQEPGLHKININAFGETIHGREFRLTLPEYTFNVEDMSLSGFEDNQQEEVVDTNKAMMMQREEEKLAAEQKLMALKEAQAQEQAAKEEMQIIIIVAGNTLLLLIAGLGFWLFKRAKRKS